MLHASMHVSTHGYGRMHDVACARSSPLLGGGGDSERELPELLSSPLSYLRFFLRARCPSVPRRV